MCVGVSVFIEWCFMDRLGINRRCMEWSSNSWDSYLNYTMSVQVQVYLIGLNYLYDRKQRVCLNGVYSNTVTIEHGVPQGSIFGPLLFLIYINDIVSDITSNVKLFADDTSLSMVVEKSYNNCRYLK